MKRAQRSTDAAATDAVRRCFEAYGGDIAKWPADERARYGALARSAEFAANRNEALSLDGFLNAASAPHVSADLKDRIAAQYVPPARPKLFRRGEGPQALRRATGFGAALSAMLRPLPAGAAAGLGALGFAAGLATNGPAFLAPEYEAYAYMQEATTLAMLDEDEEAAAWDAE